MSQLQLWAPAEASGARSGLAPTSRLARVCYLTAGRSAVGQRGNWVHSEMLQNVFLQPGCDFIMSDVHGIRGRGGHDRPVGDTLMGAAGSRWPEPEALCGSKPTGGSAVRPAATLARPGRGKAPPASSHSQKDLSPPASRPKLNQGKAAGTRQPWPPGRPRQLVAPSCRVLIHLGRNE